jgi:glyoxylase-like metal-dependent hydrolase (beta-lactamase superfamily II)/ferredoxin
MADLRKKLPANVPGEFFVDSTCINCDTCRQLAPGSFDEADGYSFVSHQPTKETDVIAATRALLSCPTGSIGTTGVNLSQKVRQDFPLQIEDNVYYCGFNSERSYGGNSYLVVDKGGNWLIDSPKFLPFLKEKFAALGGIAFVFLTHRDDVADAQKYASEFGAKRIIHKGDLSSQPSAEVVVKGNDAIDFSPGFKIIPTPGHTEGHCVLLYRDRFLFTGDHLAWSRESQALEAFEDYCWYSWEEQKHSLAKLRNFTFEWVLPGHGQKIHLPAADMRLKLDDLVATTGGA